MLLMTALLMISSGDGPYHHTVVHDPSLRRGLVAGLGVFVVLLGVLAAQCARIGAPNRDRRLAAYRLSGATPSQVRLVVALEATFSTALGAAVGIVTFVGSRTALDEATTKYGTYRRTTQTGADTFRTDTVRDRVHLLPLDVDLGWWVYGAALLLLPIMVCLLCMAVLRRVVITPLGVVRHWRVRPPRMLPAVIGAIGLAVLALFSTLRASLGINEDASRGVVVLVAAAALMTGVGLIGGTAATASALGKLVADRASSPSVLIGARRLQQSPFLSSRSASVVLTVLLVSGFVLGFAAWLAVAAPPDENDFYDVTVSLVKIAMTAAVALSLVGTMVSSAEAASVARASVTGLSATGVPRSTLLVALLVQAIMPLAAMAPVAVASGLVAARGLLGTSDTRSLGTVAQERLVTVQVPVPWLGATVLTLSCLLAAAILSAASLSLVRTSPDHSELRTTA
jgi:hypothetical protein